MMESPSKYSVEQLLKARQDGVPDYIVVPMIQKAMAEKQASQNQQSMQQGAQKPPTVAQQVLSSAAKTMDKEKQLGLGLLFVVNACFEAALSSTL